MDDALLVRALHRIGDLPGDRERLVDVERSALHALCQREAFDELEDERLAALDVLDAVNAGDVSMIERRKDPGFTLEPAQAVLIERERRREDLDRDVTLEPRIVRPVDFAHPAGAQPADHLVGSDAAAFLHRRRSARMMSPVDRT